MCMLLATPIKQSFSLPCTYGALQVKVISEYALLGGRAVAAIGILLC